MADKQELVEFAKEQGFKINFTPDSRWFDWILLPLGKIKGYEYGVAVTFGAAEPATYVLKGEEIKYSTLPLKCFTPELVIRTVELGDKEYIVETQRKRNIDDYRALILAFKFKDLGTLGPEFIRDVYFWVLKDLPKDIARELTHRKVSELEEKINEVEALSSNLPEDELNKIKFNILREREAYICAAVDTQVVPREEVEVWWN